MGLEIKRRGKSFGNFSENLEFIADERKSSACSPLKSHHIKVLKLIKAFRKYFLIRQTLGMKGMLENKNQEQAAQNQSRREGEKVKARLIKKPWRKKPARYNFSKLLSASVHKALHILQHTTEGAQKKFHNEKRKHFLPPPQYLIT